MKVEVGKHALPEEKYVQALVKYGSVLRRHKGVIAGGVLLVLIGGLGGLLVLYQRAESSARAWEAVYDLDPADDLDSVSDLAAGTDAEPFFILEAGRFLFDRGTKEDLARAEELYRRFVMKWPDHPGAVYAKQSLGYVLEQKNEFEQALGVFSSLVQDGGHLKDQSMWDAGRCAERAGKSDAARNYYQRLKEEGSPSSWTLYAETRLAALLSEKPKTEEKDG